MTQNKNFFFPLHFKLLIIFSIILLLTITFYFTLASFLFKKEKKALLTDINQNITLTTAEQIHSHLKSLQSELSYNLPQILKTQTKHPHPYVQDYSITLRSTKSPQTLISSNLKRFSSRTLSYSFVINSTQGQSFEFHTQLNPQPIHTLIKKNTLFETYLIDKKQNILLSFQSNTKNQRPLNTKRLSSTDQVSGLTQKIKEQNSTYWLTAQTPIRGTEWSVVSRAHSSHINKAIHTLLVQSLLYGLIVFTFMGLIVLFVSRYLTKKLMSLSQDIQKVSKGNYSVHSKVSSSDEVGLLASHFNQMTQSLYESHETIKRHNQELESKIALRTQELSEKKQHLEDTQNRLIQATQWAAVGETAGRTAHEVLNPLTALLHKTDTIEKKLQTLENSQLIDLLQNITSSWKDEFQKTQFNSLPENLKAPSSIDSCHNLLKEDLHNLELITQELKSNFELIKKHNHSATIQGRKIEKIVDGMRQLVRSSTHKSMTSAHDLIHSALATMEDKLKREGIKITKKFFSKKDTLVTNEDEFQQIFLNIIRNASQALEKTLHSHKQIIIETHQFEDKIIIFIKNNGPAISATSQQKIFEQGYTTKSVAQGTGLGLAIARRYARAMQGELSLKHSHTLETCFELTFPLITQQKKLAA